MPSIVPSGLRTASFPSWLDALRRRSRRAVASPSDAGRTTACATLLAISPSSNSTTIRPISVPNSTNSARSDCICYGTVDGRPVEFQTRPVGKFDHPLQELRARSRIVGAIVQINDQPPNGTQLLLHLQPPHLEPIDPKIARLPIAEDDGQRSRGQDQNAQRRPFSSRGRIMIPACRYRAVRAGPGFSPHGRNRLHSPSPSYRWIFPRCPGICSLASRL